MFSFSAPQGRRRPGGKTMASRLLLITIAAATLVVAEDINLDLSGYEPGNKTTHIIQHAGTITNNVTMITVLNIPTTVGFFVLQAHSYIDDVLLSSTPQFIPHSFVNGTNTGLVQLVSSSAYTFSLRSTKQNTSVLLVAIAYSDGAPIPGGCNLSFDTEIAAYQQVSYSEELIRVDVQAPSVTGRPCENTTVRLDMYHLYLTEKSSGEAMYFDGVRQMLTAEDIVRYGRKVPEPLGMSKLRRYYNAYRGTGSVFAVVASGVNRSSAYIPTVSYACDVRYWAENCNEPISAYWKFLIAAVLFTGIFISYVGHAFFRTTLFLVGFMAGTLITYLVLALGYQLTLDESTTTACAFGFVYGLFWVLLWWKFGIPVLSVLLSFALAGMLLGSIVFYAGLDDLQIFQNDLNFWMVFASITISIAMVMMLTSFHSHLVVCALIGSYAMLAPLSYYAGASLQYIVINTYRRATVEHFNAAVIDPPYQAEDMGFTFAWVATFLCSFFVQWKMLRGRPPFPPHRFHHRGARRSESSPLLTDRPVTVYS